MLTKSMIKEDQGQTCCSDARVSVAMTVIARVPAASCVREGLAEEEREM